MKKLIGSVLSFVMLSSFIAVTPLSVSAQFGETHYVENIGVPGTEELQGSKLIDSIKSFINWTLGMLATIALVLCLYAGFMMVTSTGDDAKYKKGLDIIKKAAIGLIIIGLAWLIVSIIMWLIQNLTA